MSGGVFEPCYPKPPPGLHPNAVGTFRVVAGCTFVTLLEPRECYRRTFGARANKEKVDAVHE